MLNQVNMVGMEYNLANRKQTGEILASNKHKYHKAPNPQASVCTATFMCSHTCRVGLVVEAALL